MSEKFVGGPLAGIAAMIAAQLAFILNDTLVKLLGDRLPMGEILFLRGIMAIALIATAAIALGLHRKLPLLRDRMVSWRIIGELGGTFFYLIALFQMPLANVVIIFQAVPLVVTAGAALFLAEPVGWRRWAAILAGFIGVMIVVRPGLGGFDIYALAVLVSVLFVSIRDLTTRAMPAAVPTLLLTFATAAAIAIMGGIYGLTENWVRPTASDFLHLAGSAVFLSIGYGTAILAMRLGIVSVTVSFRYIAVVFAIIAGFLVWGDVPDTITLLGTAVIVGAGLYTLYRERRRSVAHGPAANAETRP